MRETNPEIESLKLTEQEFDDSINRLDRIANPTKRDPTDPFNPRCDRCDTESFLLLNALSGLYECERCAPGLHAWSRHGVGSTRHIVEMHDKAYHRLTNGRDPQQCDADEMIRTNDGTLVMASIFAPFAEALRGSAGRTNKFRYAFEEGYEAAKQGEPRDSNPYTDDDQHLGWDKGWESGNEVARKLREGQGQ
jgi:ribosome modulation factor